MDILNIIFNQFNTRETAIILWLLILVVWAFSQKDIRRSLLNVLQSLFHKKILSVIIAAILYTVLAVLILAKTGIWGISLIKDTVYWFIGTAFVLLMNTNEATQERGFFAKILKDNLKIILVLEFILTLYTFNLWVEIILVPSLVLIGAMSAVAEAKIEYLQVKKLLDFILSAIGVVFIVFALGNIFGNLQNIVNSENLRAFILPPLLTFAFIPFVYFFALIMAYETLFVRLSVFHRNNPDLIEFAKHEIIWFCRLNLSKLNHFAKNCTQDLMEISNREGVVKMIENIKTKEFAAKALRSSGGFMNFHIL